MGTHPVLKQKKVGSARRLPAVMNSLSSGHKMGSHTSRLELSHIIGVQKRGTSVSC